MKTKHAHCAPRKEPHAEGDGEPGVPQQLSHSWLGGEISSQLLKAVTFNKSDLMNIVINVDCDVLS